MLFANGLTSRSRRWTDSVSRDLRDYPTNCGTVLRVTSFAGGEDRGLCLQLTIAPVFTELERQQVEDLQKVIEALVDEEVDELEVMEVISEVKWRQSAQLDPIPLVEVRWDSVDYREATFSIDHKWAKLTTPQLCDLKEVLNDWLNEDLDKYGYDDPDRILPSGETL